MSSGERARRGCRCATDVMEGGEIVSCVDSAGALTRETYLRASAAMPVIYVVYIVSVTSLVESSGTPIASRRALYDEGKIPLARSDVSYDSTAS